MPAPRIRRVESQREMDAIVDDYITQGYVSLTTGENTTLLRKKSWGTTGGHVICALLTVWWTIGLGNLIYALIAHYSAEKVLVRLTDPQPAS